MGHFIAIVGPSGCGKSTLLKTIAGINMESAGDLHWDGRNLSEDGDLQPHEFGYVPQFSIAYDQLTVEESIDNAIRLRLKHAQRWKWRSAPIGSSNKLAWIRSGNGGLPYSLEGRSGDWGWLWNWPRTRVSCFATR